MKRFAMTLMLTFLYVSLATAAGSPVIKSNASK